MHLHWVCAMWCGMHDACCGISFGTSSILVCEFVYLLIHLIIFLLHGDDNLSSDGPKI